MSSSSLTYSIPLILQNDDDMAALGSILSWDEDEERTRNEMTGGQSTTGSITNKQSSKMLPDLVQFNNMKDDIPELSFLQYTGNMQGSPSNGASNSQSNDNNSSSNAQIPSQDYQQQQPNINYGQQQNQNQQQPQQSVPIGTQQAQNANFQQQVASLQQMLQQQQQQLAQNAQSQRQQGQQQQQFQSPQQGQQQQAPSQPGHQQQQQQQATMSNQLAQFVAQQALSMLQQNQQAESQRIEQEKVQQEQVRQQQQTQAMNTMVQLQQNLQRAMQQQNQFQDPKDTQQQAGASRADAQQPRQGQSVPPFNPNDPNAFLQQLQFAQIQQQFQAAQQQGNTGVQVPTPSSQQAATAVVPGQTTALQQQQLQALATAMRSQQQFQQLPQTMIEQLKLQYAQVAGNKQIPAPASSLPQSESKPSAAKKSKATSGTKKSNESKKESPDESTSSNVALTETHTKIGVVSASDTDNEASRISAALKDDDDDDDEEDEVDTSHMTPEERAVANRERNKEHARNTRLRKKAYLEKLKATVDDLCKERNTLVAERASAAKLLVEMHNTRTEVLMSFFALRSTFEKRRHLWASILDESCFACIMPITPYRSFPASEMQVSKCQRTILGIDGIMGDTASLHVLLASLVVRSRVPLGKIEFRYTLVAEEAVVAGNQMMARWVMSTTNAMQCGAKMEIYKQGMLCCRFNSSHKIVGLELMFDVMAFMLQLKQAAGLETFSVVPNTVQTCQRTFDKPVVMTAAEPPYTIVQVNKLWEDMTGYSADQVVGKASCAILQGARTDRKAVEDMMTEVRFKRAAFSSIINYKRSGAVFRNFIALYPLSTDSRIAHYLAITEYTDDGESQTGQGGATMQSVPQISLPILSVFQQQQTPSQQQTFTNILSAPGMNQASSMLGLQQRTFPSNGSDSMSFSGSTGTKRSHDSGQ